MCRCWRCELLLVRGSMKTEMLLLIAVAVMIVVRAEDGAVASEGEHENRGSRVQK